MFSARRGTTVSANTPLGAKRKAEKRYRKEGKAISVEAIPQDGDWDNQDDQD
jgi:hypothetical protein